MGRVKNEPSQKRQRRSRNLSSHDSQELSSDPLNLPPVSQNDNFLDKHEDTVNKAITFILKACKNLHPIKRADIFQLWDQIHLSRRESSVIIKTITRKLKNVYGIRMKKVEGQKFLLVNPVNNFLSREDISASENLLILILTSMAMNKYKMSAESLENNLAKLGVNLNSTHQFYGDISHHLKEFEKQMYIKKVNNGNEIIFEWGMRALLEINKHQIVGLVADVLELDEDHLLNDPQFCELMELKDDETESSDSSESNDSE